MAPNQTSINRVNQQGGTTRQGCDVLLTYYVYHPQWGDLKAARSCLHYFWLFFEVAANCGDNVAGANYHPSRE